MANFIAVVDGDAERRRRFLAAVRTRIAPVDSLSVDCVKTGEFACVWAVPARSPVSSIVGSDGAAIIWGDAIPGPGPERIDAEGLLREWNPRGGMTPSAFDGFYAALRYDDEQGITLGADLLGYFPVYYGFRDGVLIAGASPELFRHHPFFPVRISNEGLAGVLLVHSLASGRSLLDGVRRLNWAHALRWRHGEEPREVRQYSIPDPPTSEAEPFQDGVKRLDAALESAVRRHVPSGETHGLLLSGGRDSRMLGGYVRERGDTLQALTFGLPTDYEVICAKRVATKLGLMHRAMSLDEDQLPESAGLQSMWEHLAMGFSNLHMWGAIEPLRDLPARVVCGHGLETRAGEPLPSDFDAMFDLTKHRGIKRVVLRRLLRPERFAGVQDAVEQELRNIHRSNSDLESHRAWRFYLDHDWRSHAGGVPWKLTFGSWPIVPICDREVMNTIATLPGSTIADRAAHDEIMRTRFPDLARLPLDRNNHDTLPLSPSTADRIRQRAMQSIRRRIPQTIERRYYHRVYDINGPGWRGVRRLAEPHRERLADMMSMDVLAELVPPPDTHIEVEHKVRDTFGTKLLIGLMLWSATHLS